MPKSSRRRKIHKMPFVCPERDNTSDIEEEYSDTLSIIQVKNIPLLTNMAPNATSVVLTPSTQACIFLRYSL